MAAAAASVQPEPPSTANGRSALARRARTASTNAGSSAAFAGVNLLALLIAYLILIEPFRRMIADGAEAIGERRQTLARGHDAIPASTAEHAAVVEAIAARDPELAGRLLYEHVRKSRERLASTTTA
jgi:DNA-binding GntR family transcriptional regulator